MAILTSIGFIRICNEEDNEKRLKELAKKIGIRLQVLTPYMSNIDSILNFIREIDTSYGAHEDGRRPDLFLNYTLHQHIASDLRSLIILAATKQNYQLNIILRHFIEVFVMTLWADMMCNFKGAFSFFLKPNEWKPYRKKQMIFWDNKEFPNRSVKNRLESIRLQNLIRSKEKMFYKRYFASASYCDFRTLFSLPMCNSCKNSAKYKGEVKYYSYHLITELRKRGKEDIHSVFKTNFAYVCSFCNRNKLTGGYVIGIPETTNMLDMLIAVSLDKIVHHLATLKKLYGYLSRDFVHFSTSVMMDRRPVAQNISGKTITIWGLEGVMFCLEILEPLMKYYFFKLKESRRKKR